MLPEPSLLTYPLSTLILYFVFYSFAGWTMETIYCSILEKRFVPRGFLHGPICPIYGVGVLLMILFFKPLAGNIFLFYVVSTVTMSAWEYFVGWFLEVTTHMKYWDYSMYRFNLKGRICLWVCLVWGLLSYVCIFWIHPPVEQALAAVPLLARQIIALLLSVGILADAVVTIRELALMTTVMNKLQTMGGELQVQMALGKAELSDKLSGAKDMVTDKLSDAKGVVTGRWADAKEALADAADAAAGQTAKARAKYNELLAAAERRTRRFRHTYAHFTAPKVSLSVRQDVRDKAQQVASQRKGKKARKGKK